MIQIRMISVKLMTYLSKLMISRGPMKPLRIKVRFVMMKKLKLSQTSFNEDKKPLEDKVEGGRFNACDVEKVKTEPKELNFNFGFNVYSIEVKVVRLSFNFVNITTLNFIRQSFSGFFQLFSMITFIISLVTWIIESHI
jgi:hypothetical protein